MDQYSHYTLISYSAVNTIDDFKAYYAAGKIPGSGVRLDDKLVSLACRCGLFSKAVLHENWPAEFDQKGDLRARRVPLGNPSKMFFGVGSVDVKGRELASGEEGYYYLWHRGISLLCGEEGFDPATYLVRPSYYDLKKRVDEICFLKELKAVEQDGEAAGSDSSTHSTPAPVKKSLKLSAPRKPKETVTSPSQPATSTSKRQPRRKVEVPRDDEQTDVDTDAEVPQEPASTKKKGRGGRKR